MIFDGYVVFIKY